MVVMPFYKGEWLNESVSGHSNYPVHGNIIAETDRQRLLTDLSDRTLP
jgi:hypothetical protein